LANLLSIGIITSDTNNNRLYYEVSQTYEYYDPLAAIFGGGVMIAPDAPAVESQATLIKSLGNVDLALFTGQFTRDESSGVDLVIVGDINQTKLAKFVAELERREGKELRYTAMTSKEFTYRRQVNDRFLSTVLAAKSQVLIDKHGDFHTDAKEV
jgi:hypothetical protein